MVVVIVDGKALEEARMSRFEEVDFEAFESLFGFVLSEENDYFDTFVGSIGEDVVEVEVGVKYFC